MTKLRSWPLISILLLLLGCATVPITGRSQLSMIKNSELIPMSFQQYEEVLKANEISENNTQATLIKKVGVKIQKAVETYLEKEGQSEVLNDFEWEFNLIEDKTVNAWCMPGGKATPLLFKGSVFLYIVGQSAKVQNGAHWYQLNLQC